MALEHTGGMAVYFEKRGAETGAYPPEWPAVALLVKQLAGWRCEHCGVEHGPVPAVLTVHHLNGDKWDLRDANLVALCQRCHLHIQGRFPRIDVDQLELWPGLEWLARRRESLA